MENAIIKELESLGRGYLFFAAMQRLSLAAANEDASAIAALERMAIDCTKESVWQKKSYWCVAVIRALVFTKGNRFFQILIDVINKLPDNIPCGGIELLGNLLPTYGEKIFPDIYNMIREKNKEAVRAIGIQAFCNMYLEGTTGEKEILMLQKITKEFQSDRYFTENLIELVQNKLSGLQKIDSSAELDELLENVIVEK